VTCASRPDERAHDGSREPRVWLDKQKGLLPCAHQPCKKHEEYSIRPGASRSFHVPTENDELLAEEGIFRDELGLASAKVCTCCEQQREGEWFRPANIARVKHIPAVNLQPQEMRKNTTHRIRFSIT
jgi:hypothetical protein